MKCTANTAVIWFRSTRASQSSSHHRKNRLVAAFALTDPLGGDPPALFGLVLIWSVALAGG